MSEDAFISACHHAPLVIVEFGATDDHPAGRTGNCSVCNLSCWTWIDGGSLDLGVIGTEAGQVHTEGDGEPLAFTEEQWSTIGGPDAGASDPD